ncbi:MAG: DUF4097 family beta strand repeat-containing protein [Candidatus Limivivens sp.]|nr:DUF4097 family beta strand repeat-containing protein [Candidatus Limivivens sp.]
MRRFTKICLAVAAFFILAGIAFSAVGISLGGDLTDLDDCVYFDTVSRRFVSVGDEKDLVPYSGSFRNVKNLDIEVGQAEFTMAEADVDEVTVTAASKVKKLECSLQGDTLVIETKSISFWNIGDDGDGGSWIRIEVPRGTVFDTIALSAGVGTVDLTDLTCRRLEVESGVGSVYFAGDVTGTCRISGGVGEVEMKLAGSAADFNYSLDCGIGEITVGDSIYSGLGNTREINHQAKKEMDVDCGIGSVRIYFEEE